MSAHRVDLGHGVTVWPFSAGVIVDHPDGRDPNRLCTTTQAVDGGWRPDSPEPLTVTCHSARGACGFHGTVSAGRWQAA